MPAKASSTPDAQAHRQLEKTHTLKEVRRDKSARMETVLTEKKKSAPAA